MKYSGILLIALFLTACGGGQSNGPDDAASTESGLSAEQMEHGIGPISGFDPGPIDPNLAAKGQEIFTLKCSACHKMDERYVGPQLRDVTSSRSPAYIMNMMLNPQEMVEKHPEARALFAQFMTPMPNQKSRTLNRAS